MFPDTLFDYLLELPEDMGEASIAVIILRKHSIDNLFEDFIDGMREQIYRFKM